MKEEYRGKTIQEVYAEKVAKLSDEQKTLYQGLSRQVEYLVGSVPGGEHYFKGLIVQTLFSTPLDPEVATLSGWYLGFIAGVAFAGFTVADEFGEELGDDGVVAEAEQMIDQGARKYDSMFEEGMRRRESGVRFGEEPEPVNLEDEFRIDPRGF